MNQVLEAWEVKKGKLVSGESRKAKGPRKGKPNKKLSIMSPSYELSLKKGPKGNVRRMNDF